MNVTTTLLLSLKQDIDVLNKLVDDIPKPQEAEQLKSWLFPSRSYDFVAKVANGKIFKNASYQNYLEITLDRLYVLMRLMILHINTSNDVFKVFMKNEVIIPPNRLTLGYCANLLWNSIIKIMEKEPTKKTTNVSYNRNICDNESQTNNGSLNICDSCSSAILCMKNLVNFFKEKNDYGERLKLKYNLFEITQFGSMLKVTSSIEDCLKTLYQQLYEKKIENDALKLENEHCKRKLEAKETEITFFEAEIGILRGKIEKDCQEILVIKDKNGRLIQEIDLQQNEIKNLRNIENNLNVCLKSVKQENKTINEQNAIMRQNIETMTELSKYVLKLNKKIGVLEDELDLLKCIIKQYEQSINCLNIKLAKLTKNVEKIEFKIKYRYECMQEVLQDFSQYEGFCMKVKELFKEKLKHIAEKQEKPPDEFKIKGNPIEDFRQQIEENKNKIKTLENENLKLEQLLTRFKNITTG